MSIWVEAFAEPKRLSRELAQELFGLRCASWRNRAVSKLRKSGCRVAHIQGQYYFDMAEWKAALGQAAQGEVQFQVDLNAETEKRIIRNIGGQEGVSCHDTGGDGEEKAAQRG